MGRNGTDLLILRFGGTYPALSFMKSFTVSANPTPPSTAARGRRKHETIQQVLQGERVFCTPHRACHGVSLCLVSVLFRSSIINHGHSPHGCLSAALVDLEYLYPPLPPFIYLYCCGTVHM